MHRHRRCSGYTCKRLVRRAPSTVQEGLTIRTGQFTTVPAAHSAPSGTGTSSMAVPLVPLVIENRDWRFPGRPQSSSTRPGP